MVPGTVGSSQFPSRVLFRVLAVSQPGPIQWLSLVAEQPLEGCLALRSLLVCDKGPRILTSVVLRVLEEENTVLASVLWSLMSRPLGRGYEALHCAL